MGTEPQRAAETRRPRAQDPGRVVRVEAETMEEICSGANWRFCPCTVSSMRGLVSSCSTTLYVRRLMSCCRPESWNERPMMRFASLIVFAALPAACPPGETSLHRQHDAPLGAWVP
jgi:hypothetical protein